MDEQRDWRSETSDSIKARLEAAKESQSRTRLTLVVMAIVAVMMCSASYNAYLSFNYYWAVDTVKKNRVFDPAKKNASDILTEQELRTWADARNVSISLLGILVSIDDGPILGTGTMLVLSVWLLLSSRRENHTIGFLLRDTDSTPAPGGSPTKVQGEVRQLRWLIFHSVVSNTLFTNFNHSFARISSLTEGNPTDDGDLSEQSRRIRSALFQIISTFFFFFPVLACAISFALDRWSYFRPSPFQLNAQAPADAGSPDATSWVIFTALWVPVALLCFASWFYSNGTEILLRKYREKIQEDLIYRGS